MGRNLLIRWMVLLPQLLHLSVSKLLLIAKMSAGSASILCLFFIFIEISIEKMWLHEYVDEMEGFFFFLQQCQSILWMLSELFLKKSCRSLCSKLFLMSYQLATELSVLILLGKWLEIIWLDKGFIYLYLLSASKLLSCRLFYLFDLSDGFLMSFKLLLPWPPFRSESCEDLTVFR